jgi:type I restriction enzyme M protein
MLDGVEQALLPEKVLDRFKIRGALASYFNDLATDFKSIAASGWTAELIPDEEILQSQFPKMLEELEQDDMRIAELEGLFQAVEPEDGEDADEFEDDEIGVLPKAVVDNLKEQQKEYRAIIKTKLQTLKNGITELYAHAKDLGVLPSNQKKSDYIEGLNAKEANFDVLDRIMILMPQTIELQLQLGELDACRERGKQAARELEVIAARLEKHDALAKELRDLKAQVKDVHKKSTALVEAARDKIDSDTARRLIVERLHRELVSRYQMYVREYQRGLIAAIENLWDKYAVNLEQILTARDQEAELLDRFMVELGYTA